MPDWDPEEAARLLGLDDSFGPWLRHLQGLGEVPALPLLDPGEAIGLLVRLGASAGDAAEIGALLPALQQDAALWGLVERCHQDLIRAMGDENAAPFQSPHLPEHLGAIGGLFWLYVLLAAVENVRQWHATNDIPDDVSWATLAPLADHIRQYRSKNDRWGVELSFFFTLAFRGVHLFTGRDAMPFHRKLVERIFARYKFTPLGQH